MLAPTTPAARGGMGDTHWKKIVALNALLGEAIGTIIGVSMRDDISEELGQHLEAIAKELRDKSDKLKD